MGGCRCTVVCGEGDFTLFLASLFFFFFFGARWPAINYSRKLVQAYTRIGMYKKK